MTRAETERCCLSASSSRTIIRFKDNKGSDKKLYNLYETESYC